MIDEKVFKVLMNKQTLDNPPEEQDPNADPKVANYNKEKMDKNNSSSTKPEDLERKEKKVLAADSVTRTDKIEFVRNLESLHTKSYTTIRRELNSAFGAALSNSDILKIKQNKL